MGRVISNENFLSPKTDLPYSTLLRGLTGSLTDIIFFLCEQNGLLLLNVSGKDEVC